MNDIVAPAPPNSAPTDSDLEDTVGFNAVLGMKLVEWSDSHAVMELPIREMHLNRSNALHGGVIATLIDAVCGYAGVWVPPGEPRRKALTLSLTTSYTGQVREGKVRATAVKKGGGRNIFFATCEVQDDAGNLVAFGEGSYRYRKSDPFGDPPKG